jgi:hypothetical protein
MSGISVITAISHIFSKGFDFAITDIDDTAPTDIQLSNKTLVKGQAADTLIGTLSANDVDVSPVSASVVERVPKSVLAAVFSAIVWLSVEFPIDRIISVGELLLLLGLMPIHISLVKALTLPLPTLTTPLLPTFN